MPDTKSPGDPESPEPKKGGPKRLVMIAALCVGLLGGGYVLGGKMSSPSVAADDGTTDSAEPGADPDADTESESEEHDSEVGVVVDLEAVNINLADNHYLRVAISLGLSPEVELEEPEEFHTAPASDLLLDAFSGRSIDELATPTGRDGARQELLSAIEEHYHGEVTAVFFTEFVMQ